MTKAKLEEKELQNAETWDYERAEAQRVALVSYSESLVTQFQEFAARLRAKLDELTATAPETTT